MKTAKIISVIAIAFLVSTNVFAEEISGITFISSLKAGDSGLAVLALQKLLNNDKDTRIADFGVGSPGQESDYFGSLTKNAVVRFQEKYRSEVLIPVGLSNGTGYVGAMTIKKLNELASVKTPIAANPINPSNPYQLPTGPSSNVSAPKAPLAPVVFSVSPNRVRRGDTVTIKGKNFTPVNNTIILGDGPVKYRFDGLASFDGTTLTFVYEPPVVKTMTKDEILALPADTVKQIEDPILKAGVTIDDALTPYKGINNEAELRDILSKNGRSFDEMYHYFHVLVFNSQGNSISETALLHGLRDFPFDKVASKAKKSFVSKLGEDLTSFISSITPIADAQMKGGGYTSGIVMVCTCNGSLMTFQIDYTGKGTGLYVFSPGFRPSVGSGLVAGPWLGGFQIMGGTCTIYAGYTCISIMGNAPSNPVGYAF